MGGRDGPGPLQPRSPEVRHCILILWEVQKGCCLVPQLPIILLEFGKRIQSVAPTVTPTILTNVWFDLVGLYRRVLRQANQSALTEHL